MAAPAASTSQPSAPSIKGRRVRHQVTRSPGCALGRGIAGDECGGTPDRRGRRERRVGSATLGNYYCRAPQAVLFGKASGRALGRTDAGTPMPETSSATTSLLSRPFVLLAAVAAVMLAGTLALWAHYGTAVFYEMIVAGITACL